MTEGLERIGVHLPSLLIYSVNFAILTGVLYLIAFRPMLAGIRKRAEERDAADALLDASETEAHEQHLAAVAEVNAAREQAMRIVDQAMVRARREHQEAVERGLQQAHERAEADIQAQRERVHAEGAALAVAAADRVIRQALGKETHSALIRSALGELAHAEVVVPDKPEGLAVVASAVALTAEEWHTVGESLRSLLGDDTVVVHHVRPDLLGGLAIEVGDTVIDATVLGKLHQLHDELVRGDATEPD